MLRLPPPAVRDPAVPDWVIDTNVVVSALLTRGGTCARLLDAAYSGRFRLSYDLRMVAEYQAVLVRPRLKLPVEARATFLNFVLLSRGVVVAPTPCPFALSDPGDQAFAEVAFTNPTPVVVTGNAKHFAAARPFGLQVLTPAKALESLR